MGFEVRFEYSDDMKAFAITAPMQSAVEDVQEPIAGDGEVVIDVSRVGICGTDQEYFTGEMVYLHTGKAGYPMRIGHEWCGTVSAIGNGVDKKWLGQRVTGDTMLGCGTCYRCTSGRQHVCESRSEVGISHGFAGALAEKFLIPARALHALPDSIDDAMGAMVEPGGNSLRASQAALAGPGRNILIWGTGTIGLLTALFAQAAGANVYLIGRNEQTIALAKKIGIKNTSKQIPQLPTGFDAVIDATNDPDIPALAVSTVEPGGRIVYIGIAGEASYVDSRVITLADVTVIGILSGSPGLAGTIEMYASGKVDPRPLIAATISLSQVSDVFLGKRPAGAGDGPKIHIDPRI